jgi:hypothetical protein
MKYIVMLCFLGFSVIGEGQIIRLDLYNLWTLGIAKRDSLIKVHRIAERKKYRIINNQKNLVVHTRYDKSGLAIFSDFDEKDLENKIETEISLIANNVYEVKTSIPINKESKEKISIYVGEAVAKYLEEDKKSVFKFQSIYRMNVDSVFEISRFFQGNKIDSLTDYLSESIALGKNVPRIKTIFDLEPIEKKKYQIKDSLVNLKIVYDSINSEKWTFTSFLSNKGFLLKTEQFNSGDSDQYYYSKEDFVYNNEGNILKKRVFIQSTRRIPPIEIDSFMFWANGKIREKHIDKNGTWPKYPDEITKYNEQGLEINYKVFKTDFSKINAPPVIFESKYFYNKQNDLIKEIRFYKGEISDVFVYTYKYFD